MVLGLRWQLYALLFLEFMVLTAVSLSQPFWLLIIAAQIGENAPSLHLWNAAMYALPLIIGIGMSTYWGGVADKIGYKKMAVRAAMGLIFTQGLLIFADNPAELLICRMLQGALGGFVAASQTLGVNMVPSKHRGYLLGCLQSSVALGMMVGPFMGGFLMHHYSYNAIFIFSSALCAVSLAMIVALLDDPAVVRTAAPKIPCKKRLSDFGSNFVWHLGLLASVQTARMMILPVFSLYTYQNISENHLDVGILYGASGLMLILLSPWLAKRHQRHLNRGKMPYGLVMAALVGSAVLHLGMVYASDFYSMLCLRVLWGICLAVLVPILFANLMLETHPESGRQMGYGNAATKIGDLMGVGLGSLAAWLLGVEATIYLIACVYLASLLGVVLFMTKLEEPSLNASRFGNLPQTPED